MKALSGLRVDVLLTGTQGSSPSVLHLEGSARLLSSFLPASASRFLPLWHRLPRVLYWGLTPTNILLKVKQVSWFPLRPAAVFCKTSPTVTMPTQEEGGLSFRLFSASVILVPTLTKGKAGGSSSFFLLFINSRLSQDWMESNTLFSSCPPLTAMVKTRNQNLCSFCYRCNVVFSTALNSAATLW